MSRGPTWGKSAKFVDPFGPKVRVLYGGGDCVTVMQDGSKAVITMGKDRATEMARAILKKLNEPIEEPESVKQGRLPF